MLLSQVLTRSQRLCEARVIGSLMDFVHAPDEPKRLQSLLKDGRTKMLSLTITEKGYCMATDGNLDKTLPAVKADIKVTVKCVPEEWQRPTCAVQPFAYRSRMVRSN